MAWDTERTRQLLLDAATSHFSAHGFAGARVDAIAKEAGVNKERIYQYFGDKKALFSEVLMSALARLFDAAEFTGTGEAAVGAYAGALFDRYSEHPQLPRLLAWEGLETGVPHSMEARLASCRRKVDAIRGACPWLDDAEARHLLLSLVTLINGWWALHQLTEVMLPVAAEDAAAAQRRAAIVSQVTSLAARWR